MQKFPALFGMALFCLSVTPSHGQSVDSTADKIANFPTRLLNKLSGRDVDLQQQLIRQSQKYVLRMERKEQKLKTRLYRLDSAKAAALYAQNPQEQYASLLQKLRQDSAKIIHSMGPEYLPYADSLQGMLGFLSKNPQLLNANPALQGQVQNSLAQLQLLQAKLQDADAIKQFIQIRKAQIQQYLSQYSHLPPGIGSALQGYNKEAYYYAEQVRQYRQMLNDPDKMLQTALGLLQKIPAFTTFMNQNGFLAGLLSVPAGYGTDQGLVGLQSRDQVLALVNSQVGQGGSAGTAAIQTSLNTAQEDITKLQNKLSSLGGGSGDMDMPDFAPNHQRTKTLWHRLDYGMNLQTQQSYYYFPTTTDIGFSVGYKISDKSTFGLGISYKVGWGSSFRDINISSQGAGLRSFIDIRAKKSFYLTGGFEYNYQPIDNSTKINDPHNWTRSGLAGVSKIVSMKTKIFKSTKLQLLWDFLSYYQMPRQQPIKFRVGYNF